MSNTQADQLENVSTPIREIAELALDDKVTESVKIEDSANRTLIRKWLNRSMRVKITDGRTVIGVFLCTDKHSNLILGSCHEYFDMSGKFR